MRQNANPFNSNGNGFERLSRADDAARHGAKWPDLAQRLVPYGPGGVYILVIRHAR